MFVNMSITDYDTKWECTLYEEHVICEFTLKLSKNFHLREIRCEVSNEAIVRPIATTATLFVIRKYRLISTL